ncbi:serine/threonine-protein kinase STE20-like [Nilaparvata lugens]|uniref:serine/threonine-protein kinase STE20-like n=1 Tax=Nilaparvata lugens TaxID=108931 RepID=UPI00193E073F|nr:serine/threonine-protein kinase STE20-like [Nilaparvata lugens]
MQQVCRPAGPMVGVGGGPTKAPPRGSVSSMGGAGTLDDQGGTDLGGLEGAPSSSPMPPLSTSPQPRRDSQGKGSPKRMIKAVSSASPSSRRYSLQPQKNVVGY